MVVFFNLKIMGVAYHNLLLTNFWARSSIFCYILQIFIPHFSCQQHNTFFYPPFLLDYSHFSNIYHAFYMQSLLRLPHEFPNNHFASPHIIGSIHHCHSHIVEYIHILNFLHLIKPLIKGITKMWKSFCLMPKQVF